MAATTNLIEYYIGANAQDAVIKRGWDLFLREKVEQFLIHEDGKTVEATVKGSTDTYTVFISDYKNMNIQADCDCPYDWGGICKHCVAALYQLADKKHLLGTKKKLSNAWKKQRHSTTPLILERFEILSEAALGRYLRGSDNDYYEFVNIEQTHLSPNGLWFVISDEYSHGYEYITKIYKEKGKYYCHCTCDALVSPTCRHETEAIRRLMEIGKRSLEYFQDSFMQATLEKFCDANKFPGKYASEEFIKIQLDDLGQPRIFLNGSLQGLICSTTAIDGQQFYDLFQTKVKPHTAISKSLFKPVEANTSTIGFVFELQMNYSDNVGIDSMRVISGKANAAKNKIVSNIKTIDISDLYSLQVSDTEKEAVVLCEKINGLSMGNSFDEPDMVDDSSLRQLHEYMGKLFELLTGNPMVYCLKDNEDIIRKSNLQQIQISTEPLDVQAMLSTDDEFISLTPNYRIGDQMVPMDSKKIHQHSQLIWNYKNSLHLIRNSTMIYAISFVEEIGVMKAFKSGTKDFIENIVIPFSERFKLDINGLDEYKTDEIFLKPIKKQVFLSELEGHILFLPVVIYNHKKEAQLMSQGNFVEHDEGMLRIFIRNVSYESEFLNFLRSLHPDFSFQNQEGALALPLAEMMMNNWFFDAFEKMKTQAIEIHGLQLLKSFKYSPYRATINTGIKSGQDWFDVELSVSFGDEHIGLPKLKKHILNKEKFIRLDDGSMGILPDEWIGKLEKYFRLGEIKGEQLQVSKLRFGLIEELFDNIDDSAILAELAEKKKRLASLTEIAKVRKPAAIKASLRDYQKEGLNWLNFLSEMSWGGILADDMGLGKTVQIIAFLASQKSKRPKTSLVVVPTTLIFNWENEIKKFYPSLDAMFYYGQNREKSSAEFKKYQLVITSYGLMVNDIEHLRKVKFNYVILDESQAIKNPMSKRYKAACLLKGKNKLTLTGTPIENNTFDLFAQMSFVNPGLLGTPKSFKDYYSTPIDKEKDPGRANELRKLISPFIMRRTKEQVATELPPKTEDVLYCQMQPAQRATYEEYKNKYRNFILNKIDESGLGKSKLSILEGLLKLRQICNSPKLIGENDGLNQESVKLQELMRQINEKTGKHKIVVFSQFVKMLKLIETELINEAYNYEYFDGSSTQKQRRSSVERFQNDENCRIFLISLKAGGTGINLTAADYVYIFDPWWNPAVESQAIDRTYRIGQDKKVFAYRMICKDTVEEKILKYQDQKKALASDIIRPDESFVKQLNPESIRDLFE